MRNNKEFSQFFKGRLKSRLSLSLVFYVAVCSLFFTLIASAFQLYMDFSRNVNTIEQNFNFIEDSYLPIIARTAYDVDIEQLKQQLNGILQFQDIEYLEINKKATGFNVFVGNPDVERDFVGVLAIKQPISDGSIFNLGTLTVVASYKDIYRRLWGNVVVILISTMIQVFPIALFTLFMVQFLIIRHLAKMAGYAETLNIDSLDTVLSLNRKPSPSKKPDELDHVVKAFNNLQQRIKKDLIELNEVELALRENEKKLFGEKQFSDTLIGTLPVIFYLFEDGKRLVRWNELHEKVTGYSEDELNGKDFKFFFSNEESESVETMIQQVLNEGSGVIEANLMIKNGDKIPYYFSSKLLVREEKRYLVGTGVDISALKSAEKELYLTKYSIDNSSISAYWISRDGMVYYANKAANEILGYSAIDLMSLPFWEIVTYFKRDEFESQWKEIKEKQSFTFESTQKNKNGDEIPIEVTTSFQEFEGEEYIFAYIQDISDRKKAEIERSRLVSVIEQSNDSIIITDLQGNIEYVNLAFEQITGYTRSDVFKQNPRFLKSGKQDDKFYHAMWKLISSGKVWKGNMINKCKDGTFVQESATVFPITNSNGEITNYAAVKRDITEQIRFEEQMQQNQKLEAIGTLAGGIAHDFNNILGAIYGYTRLAQKKLPDAPENQIITEYLAKVLSAGSRAEDLVSQILTFSRKAEFEPKTIDLKPLIKESIKFLEASLPSTISIKYKIDPDINKVFGDYTQIHQIIMNLCTNASHAMEEKGGELEISLSNFQIISHSPQTCNLEPGSYVHIFVRDTGIGMDEQTRKRIFEPFYTTKEKGKGTGLGLSVVHGIVEKHGGGIKVYSQINMGTKFSVYLPVSNELPVKKHVFDSHELPKGTESILLVDDENDISLAYGEMLTMQGYKVNIINDSVAALEEFTSQPDSYDIVITDFTMPKMDGIVLSKKILAQKQNTPIIIVSGLGELISTKEIESAGIKKILSKPLGYEELVISVRSILDNSN